MRFCNNRQRKPSKGAFTLVELLVVMAIIALLVSLLFPTFGSIKEQGRIVKCKNNLRTLWEGFQAYAQDHNGKIAANTGWNGGAQNYDGHYCQYWLNGGPESWGTNGVLSITTSLLYPYINSIQPYLCPSMPSDRPQDKGRDYKRSYELGCYLGNAYTSSYAGITDENGQTVFRNADTFTAVRRPSLTLMLVECNDMCDDGWYVRPGNGPGNWHFSKSPVLYVDGHVELCSTDQANIAYEAFYHQPDLTMDPSKR